MLYMERLWFVVCHKEALDRKTFCCELREMSFHILVFTRRIKNI
jgi:hypothetical protein